MLCCCLCFFSNYEMPKVQLARDSEYYKEMSARVELKNQALENKIAQLSVGRDVSFEDLNGPVENASPLGKFHRPETLDNQNTAPKKKYTLFADDFNNSQSDSDAQFADQTQTMKGSIQNNMSD